jgi:hypothetical protein
MNINFKMAFQYSLSWTGKILQIEDDSLAARRLKDTSSNLILFKVHYFTFILTFKGLRGTMVAKFDTALDSESACHGL